MRIQEPSVVGLMGGAEMNRVSERWCIVIRTNMIVITLDPKQGRGG
jgi:hypothetical protein